MESRYVKQKVNNEIELCKVNDKQAKTDIEKALLKERISYFIKWEKPSLFSADRRGSSCVFCVNEWQVEAAETAISDLGEAVVGKIKYIRKRTEKILF